MRCLACLNLSWQVICQRCQSELLRPSIRRRRIGSLDVYSFYAYSEIEKLLLSKYSFMGSALLKILANNSLAFFAKEFTIKASVIGVDDRLNSFGYAHTAILAHSLKSRYLRPKYFKLIAQNRVRYAGKSLDFRRRNPKNFRYYGKSEDIILVDDVVTTGTTLQEAKECCQRAGANVLFALVLADAKDHL